MLCRLVSIFSFAVIAGAVGAEAAPTKVKVVNGRDAPALVMGQTVLHPVHGNVNVRLEAGQTDADLELITPPAGQMVVVEYLTIQAFVEEATANALLTLSGDLGEDHEVQHYLDAFPPPSSLNVGITTLEQILRQDVLLYSTGPVHLDINRGQKDTLVALFDVTFSGYLVKAPQ
jgi:hypothetical protein